METTEYRHYHVAREPLSLLVMKGDTGKAVLRALAMFVFIAIVLPMFMLVLKTIELTFPLTP